MPSDEEIPMTTPDVTQLLSAWRAGDRAAFDQLLGVTYDELRRLARSHLRRERPGHTLSATGLVHEAWLSLVRQRDAAFEGRAHFFGAASHAMRRVLVSHARTRLAQKRHGERVALTAIEETLGVSSALHDLLALDVALEALGAVDPRLVRVVECRCFGGLTIVETAAALGVSHTTVSADWRFARAWLHVALLGTPDGRAA
jgi:RNA polymerase sigma factor (TIGR02999 family)